MDIIDSVPRVLLEAAVVLLVGAIRRPPDWARRFPSALLIGVPAYAWAGLGVWTFMLPWAILCHTYAPRGARVVAHFVANHPLLALAIGPLVALAFLAAGEYRSRRP